MTSTLSGWYLGSFGWRWMYHTSQRNLHLCLMPHHFGSWTMMIMGAASPNSSLRVELSDSGGPSACPAPWKRMERFGRIIFHPKVVL
jgi:hypothetical protein